jgi:hypothetical protein
LKKEEEEEAVRKSLEKKHTEELEQKEKENLIVKKYLDNLKNAVEFNNDVIPLYKQGLLVKCVLDNKTVLKDEELPEKYLPDDEELVFLVYLEDKRLKRLVLKDKKLKFDEDEKEYKLRKQIICWWGKEEKKEDEEEDAEDNGKEDNGKEEDNEEDNVKEEDNEEDNGKGSSEPNLYGKEEDNEEDNGKEEADE